MIDPRDRLLNYALLRVLREDAEPEVDLAAQIARAWERGVRGSIQPEELGELLEEPLEPEAVSQTKLVPQNGRASSHVPARQVNGHGRASGRTKVNGHDRAPATPSLLRRAPVQAAAAALVLATAGLWWWRQAGPKLEAPGSSLAGAFARLDQPATVIRGTERRRSETLEPGDAVWSAEQTLAIQLAGAGTVHLQPGSLVRFDGVHEPESPAEVEQVALLVGGLDWSVPSEPSGAGAADALLDFGFAELAPGPGGRVDAAVEPVLAGYRVSLAEMLEEPWDEPRVLSLSVAGGTSRLTLGDRIESLEPGNAPVRFESHPVDSETRKRFESLRQSLFAGAEGLREVGGYTNFGLLIDQLTLDLKSAPGLWADLAERWTKDGDPRARPVLLSCLQMSDSPRALFLARRLWREDPAAFLDDQIVSFAERGAFEFQREVAARVAGWDAADDGPLPILSAAYLAQSGDDSGYEVLAEAVRRSKGFSDSESMWRGSWARSGLRSREPGALGSRSGRGLQAGAGLPRAERHDLCQRDSVLLRSLAGSA